MQRHLGGAFTISIYPLLGAAGLIAMSGCAAVPAMSLASGLLKPAQTVQPAQAGTPAPNMLSSLAQQFGITLPGQSATASAAASPAAAETPTTTAAK